MSKIICNFLFSCFFLISSPPAFSQEDLTELTQRADNQYQLHFYKQAAGNYAGCLKIDPQNSWAIGQLASCYFMLNQPEKSLQYYSMVKDANNLEPSHRVQYGKALMFFGNYQEAEQVFSSCRGTEFSNTGKHYAEMCRYAAENANQPGDFVATNLSINTQDADFAPLINRGGLIFASGRGKQSGTKTTSTPTASNIRLYRSTWNANNQFSKPAPFETGIGSQDGSAKAPLTISEKGKRAVFTMANFINGNRQIADEGMTMRLFMAPLDNQTWGKTKAISFKDDADSEYGYPALSMDGNTLYLASNRKGGFGGWDLYLSRWEGNTWSTPTNLGPKINTAGNEISPFIDGNSLYFSSDWHPGFGGMDVFHAQLAGEEITSVETLGMGINSPADEYGFVFDNEKSIGFLTSNRPGGRGNEDIWQVTLHTDISRTPPESMASKSPMPAAQPSQPPPPSAKRINDDLYIVVKDLNGTPIVGATVDLRDCVGESGLTDLKGRFYFDKIKKPVNCSVYVSADGYRETRQELVEFGQKLISIELEALTLQDFTGRVVEHTTKKPLAEVLIVYWDGPEGEEAQTVTDNNGNFRVQMQAGYEYEMVLSKEGYVTGTLQVEALKAGAESSLKDYIMVKTSQSNNFVAKSPKPSPPEPQQKKFTGYAIQIQYSEKPITKEALAKHDPLSSYGNLYVKKENNKEKVRLGIYTSRKECEKYLKAVHQLPNYKDAFIVEEFDNDAYVIGPPNATAANNTNRLTKSTPPETYKAPILTTPENNLLFAVQLGSAGADKAINFRQYSAASEFGELYTKPENGQQKIRVGLFLSHQEAETARDKAVDLGFQSAEIVTEKKSDPALTDLIQAKSFGKPIAASATYSYFVRVATLSRPERFDPSPLHKIGGVVERRNGPNGSTIILLGGFDTLDGATNANKKLSDNGYEGTYVVKEVNGELIRQNP
jgi:hypothetical protein